ncbi:MAG TPA: hypothetical protein VKE40_10550 [Gemmataceae bacterium]|nr:hypothetical protein [Gemmataceae bacterium]
MLAIAVGAALAMAALIAVSRPEPLEDLVRRIQPGMTLAEVQDVLQARPGDHTRYVTYIRMGGLRTTTSRIKEWDWDEGCLTIHFDGDWRAQEIEFYSNLQAPSALEKVLYWLPW